jgi:hypothetical protein
MLSCMPRSAARRLYVRRMLITAGLCILFSVVASLGFRFAHLHGIAGYIIAVMPALPIMGALAATGIYLAEEKDEFQRNLLVQSFLGGTGATLSIITAWGFLEDFTHISPLGLTWVYPLFWFFTAISYSIVRLRYR